MNLIRRVEKMWLVIRYSQQNRIRSSINAVCGGYSGDSHWLFFKQVLYILKAYNILILGVYEGRDIAYIAEILRASGQTKYTITGIDLFEDTAGADWPEEKRGLTWQEAGFGNSPSLEKASANLEKLGLLANVSLVQSRADDFLRCTTEHFNLIYVDVSHDYGTTKTCIDLAIPKLTFQGVLAGDDFSDEGTWGVASAVKDSFVKFRVFYDWIWLAKDSDYRRS